MFGIPIPDFVSKYAIIGLVVMLVVSSGATALYHRAYVNENAARVVAEANLQTTVKALDDFKRSSELAMAAVSRAAKNNEASRQVRATAREKALKAPSNEDGSISPILRDAIIGVRK